jgi:integrase/recombinase XerD
MARSRSAEGETSPDAIASRVEGSVATGTAASQPVGRPRTADAADRPRPTRRSTRGRDAVTAAEREAPPAGDPALPRLEAAAAAALPDQLPLFAPGPKGKLTPLLGGLAPLEPSSGLALARAWYRRELEQGRRPRNTIESYSYDLQVLEGLIGPKRIDRIDRRDVARFLGEASSRVTRKRRLTTVRRFFRYLIDDARVLTTDPAEGFYPHAIPLRSLVPLFAEEQAAMLGAAAGDEAWALPAIWLMLRLGLNRGELLALGRDHIDLTDPNRPVVYVFYEPGAKRGQERKLAADAEFAELYADYLAAREPIDRLFPVGPPAVNVMVERVRKAAGIAKEVTPQTLRHTFAVEKAKAGADEGQLIALLGLVDDPRNRASVGRYLKLAAPPLE